MISFGFGERAVDHLGFPPENLTRAPFELGWSPSPSSSTPAFTSSSLYFPIVGKELLARHVARLGALVALRMIMNRIAGLPVKAYLLLLGDLRAQALLLLPELGRELVAEVLRLEHLANLDLGSPPWDWGSA